jgi:integrase
MAAIYRRGRVWWVKYYLNGQRIQQSLNTPLERIARQKQREMEFRLSIGNVSLPSQTPLPPFLEGFCSYLKDIRTRKGYKNDVSRLRSFFGPVCSSLVPGSTCNTSKQPRFPRQPVAQHPTTKHVQVALLEEVTTELVSQFMSRRIREDGIAAKTANRFREVLHRMFAYAIKEKGYRGPDGSRSNPIAAVDRRREPAHTIRFLTLAQIDEQLQALREHPTLHAMVATYIYAGVRREEALWLTVEDVDLQRRLIRVCAKSVDGEFWQPKTKCNRAVPIGSALLEILTQYQPARTAPWFFPSTRGRRWDPDNFSEDLREINKAHGLHWSCLHYRHTFGSQLAQKGESLYKIAALMGNSPEICRKHYAALVPEAMHDAVEFSVANEYHPSRVSAARGTEGAIPSRLPGDASAN